MTRFVNVENGFPELQYVIILSLAVKCWIQCHRQWWRWTRADSVTAALSCGSAAPAVRPQAAAPAAASQRWRRDRDRDRHPDGDKDRQAGVSSAHTLYNPPLHPPSPPTTNPTTTRTSSRDGCWPVAAYTPRSSNKAAQNRPTNQ